MTKFSRQTAVTVGIIALVTGLWATAGFAGDWHDTPSHNLGCSTCHIMHASKATTHSSGTKIYPTTATMPNPSGISTSLITSVTINNVCCGCHSDGTSSSGTPKVMSTGGTAAAPTSSVAGGQYGAEGPSAGFFQTDAFDRSTTPTGVGVPNPTAHDLGVPGEATPCGTWVMRATGMACTDCHDPHANSNWYNLRLRPGNASSDCNITYGTSGSYDVLFNVANTAAKDATNTTAHYKYSGVGFNNPAAIVTWCEGCHDTVETGAKHPQNVAVAGLPDGGANWTVAADGGVGFGSAIDDGTTGIPRVRFGQSGSTYADCRTVATTNKVFCLTCHKAHGSLYDSNFVWPYYTSGNKDQNSGCAQCHNHGV